MVELREVKCTLLRDALRYLQHIRKNEWRHTLPDEESVHLFQAELQNLLFEIPVNLRRHLQVLLKHLMDDTLEMYSNGETQSLNLIYRLDLSQSQKTLDALRVFRLLVGSADEL